MNSVSNSLLKQYGRLNSSKSSGNEDIFEQTVICNDDTEDKQRAVLIEWINSILPNLNFPLKASSEDLRAFLIDGTILLQILSRIRPGCVKEVAGSDHSMVSFSENVKTFLEIMDDLGIPRFEMADLEKGSMKTVMDCLSTLRRFENEGENFFAKNAVNRSCCLKGNGFSYGLFSPTSPEEKRKVSPDSKFQRALRSSFMSGHKFYEVFQLKQGCYADLSAAKISEMMQANSLGNAPTQSLLSVVNGILDESIERKNDEIPHRVACLLRKVVQEIQRRLSTQAEHLRTQNNLFRTREEKYQSRINVLEALASGTGEERGMIMDQLQQVKIEKSNLEEKKKHQEEDVVKLMKEKDQREEEVIKLMKEKEQREEDVIKLTKEKKQMEVDMIKLKKETEQKEQAMVSLMKEKEQKDLDLSALKKEMETARTTQELRCLQMETEANGAKAGLEERLIELEFLLEDSRNKVKVLEAYSESITQKWNKNDHIFQNFVKVQFGALQELRLSSRSIKHEILEVQKNYAVEFDDIGSRFKRLVDATKNYRSVLAENRKMFNELQDLKGNIRVYCRIRPFLPGQAGKKTTIDYIGEDGELVVVNPAKQGKDARRLFKFNKVYGPDSTQVEVFSDTQPLIRSVLDGYSVCIFAYGQTGSGKTYTMTGPSGASEEEWGVNYRALNDLFSLSQRRSSSFMYEVGVQMVEIYNEQVRDLLSNDGSQKRLGIKSISQTSELAVPGASIHPVTSTSDVLELMDLGLNNRAVGATALNERSSRSHSVVSVHVRGKELQTGASSHGNLHLVDLAGSERVDRSEVTGNRLKEAQHINKSLSALGDVIFALAQKSSHVPYRNSKLTQLLQSFLGGQAKTLMFVQLNPDANSYSETASTLKFAERVSGVELGAARSSKEGRDVRELMEQVASLKDTIAKKDDEIEQLQLIKDIKNTHPGLSAKKFGHAAASNNSVVGIPQRKQNLSGGKSKGRDEKAASDQESRSEHSDKHSEADSQQAMEDFKHQNISLQQSKSSGGEIGQHIPPANVEILGYVDGNCEERLSEISEGGLSAGAEPDGSADESTKQPDELEKGSMASKDRSLHKLGQTTSKTVSASRDSLKRFSSTTKRVPESNSMLTKSSKRWQ